MQVLGNRLDAPRRRFLSVGTVRLRLTALYGSLFLVSGAGLLAITYGLVYHATAGSFETRTTATTRTPGGAPVSVAHSHAADLHQLLIQSGIALAIMTVASAVLGWLVAGRVLAPLRTMTEATRRIAEDNLHDRLALSGPNDELKALADTIDGLLERLEAAFDAQRRFVANASHELRTPLAGMRASLDVAVSKPGPLPPQLVTLDDRLRNGFDQVDRLLESFLVLARAHQGPLPDESIVSLDGLAAGAIERCSGAIAQTQLNVEQEQCPEARVSGSTTLLARMVENVISNAVTHNQPGGWVRATPSVNGAIALLVVENGGRVLAQDDVDALPQPFRRLGVERTGQENGTGLGLSIVAAIVQAHGGTLDLQALAGGGLRIVIALPLAVAAVAGAPA
jgi:signal transduction histidine kinase